MSVRGGKGEGGPSGHRPARSLFLCLNQLKQLLWDYEFAFAVLFDNEFQYRPVPGLDPTVLFPALR